MSEVEQMVYWIGADGRIDMDCDIAPPATPQEALRMAITILQTPELRCRGAYARDIYSHHTDPCAADAVSWADYGALSRVCRERPDGEPTAVYYPAEAALQVEMGKSATQGRELIEPDMVVEEVIRAMEAAIDRLNRESVDEDELRHLVVRLRSAAQTLHGSSRPSAQFREDLNADIFMAATYIETLLPKLAPV